ncbi:MAG: hypothetical protein M3Q52_02090 [Pseudomonadota bacterium]|nr:hypothetical protein [Pseudomonadota bacterium]
MMIRARLRVGANWFDACVLNISDRGLGMQASSPPPRGIYVEVRRGPHVMIGCVAWSNGHRFGLRTQDMLAIDAIVREPDSSELAGGPAPGLPPALERRAAPRPPAERAERNRELGRALEFTFIGALAVSAAFIAFETVSQALARPMASVSKALSKG